MLPGPPSEPKAHQFHERGAYIALTIPSPVAVFMHDRVLGVNGMPVPVLGSVAHNFTNVFLCPPVSLFFGGT
jgi:hypothetical protein